MAWPTGDPTILGADERLRRAPPAFHRGGAARRCEAAGAASLTALSVALLALGVAGAVGRPFSLPSWVAPGAAAVVAVGVGAAGAGASGTALGSLASPVAFLLAAVPLSVLLDELGFFSAAAHALTSRYRSVGGLWVLAAGVTTVLNLDAAVVLLTPLYIRIARRRGLDPLGLAAQPLVLSWLASSALPVSNLTNLIAASVTGATTVGFLAHLGPPSLVAVGVGWVSYRRLLDHRRAPAGAGPAPDSEPTGGPPVCGGAAPCDDAAGDATSIVGDPAAGAPAGVGVPSSELAEPGARRALTVGGSVVGGVLAGFVAGRSVGIAAWEVALAGDVVLLAIRRFRRPPWRAVPVGTALVAASLGVLATATAARVPVRGWLGGGGVAGLARTAGVSALAANAINNLPALLVLVHGIGGHRPELWAALLGVDMGPVLVVTGTLASLLWVDTVRRMEVRVSAVDVTRIGLGVGLPGALAGLAVLLALAAAGLGG